MTCTVNGDEGFGMGRMERSAVGMVLIRMLMGSKLWVGMVGSRIFMGSVGTMRSRVGVGSMEMGRTRR